MTDKSVFDYDSIAPGYYDDVFRRSQGAQSKWHHHKFEFVRSRLGDCKDHLDIGCGPGTFIGMLDEDKRSTGVDVSIPQVLYAQKTYGSTARQFRQILPGQPLPFDDKTFDAVTLIEVIEHIDRQQGLAVLKEARRLLRPGGRVIVTTPNYASAWPAVEAILNKVSRVSYEDQHIAKYSGRLLDVLFKESGFTQVSVGSFQWSGPFWAMLGWALSDRINTWEHRLFGRHGGLLLIGEAKKV